MPIHPCIFCLKTQNRPSQPRTAYTSPVIERTLKAHLTAVPVFMGRVSPVLDTCSQLFVMESDGKSETVRRMFSMKSASIFERARELSQHRVGLIICGAVSEAFFNLLRDADIELVCGIAGDVDDVIDAYRNGALEQPRFRMPGFE